jgi:hypothetical protein
VAERRRQISEHARAQPQSYPAASP